MYEVEFKTLLGYHVLSGCDTDGVIKGEQPFYGDANVIDFVLDGRVFSAVEDPDDGYRSSLDKMFVDRVTSVKNMFPPCYVIGTRRQDREYEKNDVIDFIDVLTGKIVLSVGTENTDDYYPYFVGTFDPTAMCYNEEWPRIV